MKFTSKKPDTSDLSADFLLEWEEDFFFLDDVFYISWGGSSKSNIPSYNPVSKLLAAISKLFLESFKADIT